MILYNGMLFIGGIKGNRKGEALVGIYDLDGDQPWGLQVLNPEFDRDDHNSPVFHVRPDGSILAVYARHHRDCFHYSRSSDPKNPLKWGRENKHARRMADPRDRVTYMNLCELKVEGKLYLFFRGIDFHPSFVTSTDHGKTWTDPMRLVRSGLTGRQRPYACYAHNRKDRVYVGITEAHPRDIGTGIYYFEFCGGQYYRADGTLIQDLAVAGPLVLHGAEVVYKGTGRAQEDTDLGTDEAAWINAIAVDSNGHPHLAYSLHKKNDDHRYRLASWTGTRWRDREIAYGGTCLYDRETSYTGLIAVDPIDPGVVFISTNVDPASGRAGSGVHEIYRATIGQDDARETIEWHPVTRQSPVNNLRPMIICEGNRRVILWLRGVYGTYTRYQLDVVGFVEEVTP